MPEMRGRQLHRGHTREQGWQHQKAKGVSGLRIQMEHDRNQGKRGKEMLIGIIIGFIIGVIVGIITAAFMNAAKGER